MTKNKTRSSNKLFVIFVSIFCIMLCISFAELFSSLITTSGMSNIKDSEIKQNSFTLYAISLYSTETEALAKENAVLARRHGGAGFIWQGEDKFYVLASCYENNSDATKVKENLQTGGTTCEVIELKFDALAISSTVTGQEKTALEQSLQCYKNLYKQLYDLSVSIDTNLLTEIQAKVSLSDITSNFSKIQSNFNALLNSKLTASILEVKLSLENVEEILESLEQFSSSETPYTSMVKYSYFNILDEYVKLQKQI